MPIIQDRITVHREHHIYKGQKSYNCQQHQKVVEVLW